MFKIILACLLLVGSNAAMAQGVTAIDTVKFQKDLSELNRIRPLQNPRQEAAEDILDRRVLSSANKVVGEVQDVLLTKDGDVSSILVNFDRLRLGAEVYLNYAALDIQNVSNGYRLGFDGDEVEQLYPELLANIESASGGENLFSLKTLLGQSVATTDNKIIGTVQSVLFDDGGDYVRSVYLNIRYKNIRDYGIAVPLSALSIAPTNNGLNVRIDHKYADQIVAFIKDD